MARSAMMVALVIALGATASQAAEVSATVNPVRKVVTLLQMMQKKVTAEGETEKDWASHVDSYNSLGILMGTVSHTSPSAKYETYAIKLYAQD